MSCGAVFEKLKREAEAEDAKKAELWAQVSQIVTSFCFHLLQGPGTGLLCLLSENLAEYVRNCFSA